MLRPAGEITTTSLIVALNVTRFDVARSINPENFLVFLPVFMRDVLTTES
jgi:hypothetical protein